ncbi:Imidazole glycerol phosphate synthase subunit HisF OS=Castellaniella defragrans OX=75697 GN=hisF PE=3 SV=1 [Castellaniella defragrans]
MLRVRVIPTLLLRGQGLVKGVKFSNHRYVGDPVNAVRIFNTKEVDELALFDITATSEGRRPNFDLIGEIAAQAFMPLAYGGGVSSIEDVEQLFRIGVEKVVINSAATDSEFIRRVSHLAGAQSIVGSIDVRKKMLGGYRVCTRSGAVDTKEDPVSYAKRLEDAGVGELIVCSIDREGTEKGYDLDLVAKVSEAVRVPVVASGGAGSLSDMADAVRAGASAVAAGSMFVFHGTHKAVLITYPPYDRLEQVFQRLD